MKRLICAVTILAVSTAQADTRYVDDDAAPGGDGATWNTAYRFLRDALNEAASDETINEIRVAEGAYRPHQDETDPDGPMPSDCCEIHGTPGCDNAECEAAVCAAFPPCCDTAWDDACLVIFGVLCDPDLCTITDLRAMSFELINGLALRGGYAGQGAPDPDARDIELYETILTGDLLGDDGPDFANNEENSYHVVTGHDTDGTPELDGFTVTASNVLGSGAQGGGLDMLQGGLTIRDCHFLGNSSSGAHVLFSTTSFVECVFEANWRGMTASGEVTLTDCLFLNNNGGGPAGAQLTGTIATVTGCRFEGNVAGQHGGGLVASCDTVVMIGCDFVGNSAGGSVGGASVSGSSATVRDCTFTDNHADDSIGAFGLSGLLAEGIVEDCIFEGNTSGGDTGAMGYGHPSAALPIVNCTFTGNHAMDGDGGAIRVAFSLSFSHLVVRNSIFSGNVAEDQGGAIYATDTSATVEDCIFGSNEAGPQGGACVFEAEDEGYTINVQRCTFTGNTSEVTAGGLYVRAPCSTITDCNFMLNSAWFAGGLRIAGVEIGPQETLVAQCLFAGNTSLSSGGGASVRGNEPEGLFEDCIFVGNSAVRGGGLHARAISQDPLFTMAGCRFFGNHATSDKSEGPGRGGGVYLEEIDTVLVNCIFSGNTAEDTGGGLFIETGTNTPHGDVVDVINCTLSKNTALADTGGAFDDNHEDGTTFSNCILWGNVDATGTTRSAQIEAGSHTEETLVNYSCIQGWDGAFNGIGNIGDDPLLFEPDGADGDVGTDDDDLRLQTASPCIDAADNLAVPAGITTDLDGNPRFVDDPDTIDSGNGIPAVVDMGAYEFQVGLPCPWDCDGGESTDGTVGITDFLLLLAQWGSPGSCDFDGGGVGINDFLELLANWGPCP